MVYGLLAQTWLLSSQALAFLSLTMSILKNCDFKYNLKIIAFLWKTNFQYMTCPPHQWTSGDETTNNMSGKKKEFVDFGWEVHNYAL